MSTTTTTTLTSLTLLLCVATLGACDEGLDVDDPGALELDHIEEIGVWPPKISEPLPALSEAAPLDFVEPAEADAQNQCFNRRVRQPRRRHLIGWTRWALGQSNPEGPIADQTGEDCAMGQQGPVWYLAGTFGGPVTRECDVPRGKRLVFPLVNRWIVFPEEYYPGGDGIEDGIETWATEHMDSSRANTCGLTLRINGHDVRDSLEELDEDFYIRVDNPFELDLHPDHWATDYFDGGLMPAIGDGHYAVVNPLPPGDHTIELGGEICGDYPFSTSASYTLHVD